MRKSLLTVLCLIVFSTLSFSAFASDMKVGVVNLQDVFKNSPQLASIKADLKKQFASREQKLIDQQKALDKQAKALNRNRSVMTAKQRAAKQKSLISQQTKLQKEQIKFQQTFMAARNKQLGKLFKKIKNAVSQVARKNDYDLVLTKQAVAYTSDKYNITNQVLKTLK